MTNDQLKPILDTHYEKYHTADFITNDPVQFPRHFTEQRDIEIAALLTATISWGKRAMILRSCERMFTSIGTSPFNYVMSEEWHNFDPNQNIHRTFFGRDLQYICRGLKHIYSQHTSLEQIFIPTDTWNGIAHMRDLFIQANNNTTSRHISNPNKSACKRLHMMLRWLSRKDSPVDLGTWKSISPSILQIPLDVHVGRTALALGITSRTTNDRRTVEDITHTLQTLCPEDPIKYDFALFSIGENKIL